MASSSAVFSDAIRSVVPSQKHFIQQLNVAVKHYNAGRWTECVAIGKALTEAKGIERWLIIRTLALLCQASEDWYVGEVYRREAERHYANYRTIHPNGCPHMTPAAEAAMTKLRTELDQLEVWQQEDIPKPCDYKRIPLYSSVTEMHLAQEEEREQRELAAKFESAITLEGGLLGNRQPSGGQQRPEPQKEGQPSMGDEMDASMEYSTTLGDVD